MGFNSRVLVLLLLLMSLYACQNEEKKMEEEPEEYEAGTFGYDLNFLKTKDEGLLVLKNRSGEGQVIASAKYQGKVFTSTAEGMEGQSFGWINYEAFDGEPDPHMNAYGGENRLWLGPEGGQFSLFFPPGAEMEFENWKTPPAIDTELWRVLSSSDTSVLFQKETSLLNYAGTKLNISIRRNVRVLENKEIKEMLQVELDTSIVQAVGYQTDNLLTNVGSNPWNRESGAPCLWVLDMFKPSPATTIVIPYEQGADAKVATTDYFGEIPADRIHYENGILLFKGDGQSRGKIGLSPERAKPVAGSYDAENNILTITTFDVDEDAVYLNQEWTTEKDPFKGDAVNAYNDGPLPDGSQLGPFYELESVSPAAFLEAGQILDHQHNVFHFTGDEKALDQIAQKVLGISLEGIKNGLNNSASIK